jgi:hypothetical protein
MTEMLSALLLIEHYYGRKRPDRRPHHEPIRETESRWARILTWHRNR